MGNEIHSLWTSSQFSSTAQCTREEMQPQTSSWSIGHVLINGGWIKIKEQNIGLKFQLLRSFNASEQKEDVCQLSGETTKLMAGHFR